MTLGELKQITYQNQSVNEMKIKAKERKSTSLETESYKCSENSLFAQTAYKVCASLLNFYSFSSIRVTFGC